MLGNSSHKDDKGEYSEVSESHDDPFEGLDMPESYSFQPSPFSIQRSNSASRFLMDPVQVTTRESKPLVDEMKELEMELDNIHVDLEALEQKKLVPGSASKYSIRRTSLLTRRTRRLKKYIKKNRNLFLSLSLSIFAIATWILLFTANKHRERLADLFDETLSPTATPKGVWYTNPAFAATSPPAPTPSTTSPASIEAPPSEVVQKAAAKAKETINKATEEKAAAKAKEMIDKATKEKAAEEASSLAPAQEKNGEDQKTTEAEEKDDDKKGEGHHWFGKKGKEDEEKKEHVDPLDSMTKPEKPKGHWFSEEPAKKEEPETATKEAIEEPEAVATPAPTKEHKTQERKPLPFDVAKVQDAGSRLEAVKSIIGQLGVSYLAHLKDEESAQYLALEWVSEDDEHKLIIPGYDTSAVGKPSDWIQLNNLLQRYALAVFYYMIHVNDESIMEEEGKLLVQASEQERANRLAFDSQWMQKGSVCTWPGVICEGKAGDVVALNLTHSVLVGVMPEELVTGIALPHMTSMDLSHNHIQGPIPKAALRNKKGTPDAEPPLKELYLSHNKLMGGMNPVRHLTQLSKYIETLVLLMFYLLVLTNAVLFLFRSRLGSWF